MQGNPNSPSGFYGVEVNAARCYHDWSMTDVEMKSPRREFTGICPAQEIRALIAQGVIKAGVEIPEEQIQPASLDLRLGSKAYRVRASFLPAGGVQVMDKVAALGMHEIDLSPGAVLERECVYIVPLEESVHLPDGLSGIANPKSSTGRLDIFTRLITNGAEDRASEFDRVRAGYTGPLYAEISPRAFSVKVTPGTRLNQLRLRYGEPSFSDSDMRRLNDSVALTDSGMGGQDIAGGVPFSVDLSGETKDGLIGYRAKRHTGVIDLAKIAHYDGRDFWEPLYVRSGEGLVLNPGDFYILASKEAVRVPMDHAAEMVAYDTLVGEFRVHYAGFFDPGFGVSDDGRAGTRAVLEVRSHEVPFVIDDGQIVGRLVYERLTDVPDKIYGAGIGSNYANQTLTLAKQFIKPDFG